MSFPFLEPHLWNLHLFVWGANKKKKTSTETVRTHDYTPTCSTGPRFIHSTFLFHSFASALLSIHWKPVPPYFFFIQHDLASYQIDCFYNLPAPLSLSISYSTFISEKHRCFPQPFVWCHTSCEIEANKPTKHFTLHLPTYGCCGSSERRQRPNKDISITILLWCFPHVAVIHLKPQTSLFGLATIDKYWHLGNC